MNILTAFLSRSRSISVLGCRFTLFTLLRIYEVPIVASVKENFCTKGRLKNGDVIIAINGQYPTETADTDIYSSVFRTYRCRRQ